MRTVGSAAGRAGFGLLACLLPLFSCAADAHAEVDFDTQGLMGISAADHYYGSQTEVSAPFGKGLYEISARVRTFRFQEVFPGTEEEYSVRLKRELYHVTVAGRLGSAPPNMGRAAYHLAGGEALMTLYGLTLGPEHPELSTRVWESSGTAPSPESFDKTWITAFRVVYANTDHHIIEPTVPLRPETILVIVQNSWQFDVRETWKERTSLAFQMGHDRYNKVIRNGTDEILLDNVDYLGNGLFGVFGWPNNYVSTEVSQKIWDRWKLSLGYTRLNLLKNKLDFMYGADADMRLGLGWHVRAGYYVRRIRSNTTTHQGISLGAVYLW